MLGPELLNLSTRVPPVFLEGAPVLRLDSATAVSLGLANHQIIRGLISATATQLFLNVDGYNKSIALPEFFRRFAAKGMAFRTSLTSDGSVVLRPIFFAARPSTLGADVSPVPVTSFSSSPLLTVLFNPSVINSLARDIKSDLLAFDRSLSIHGSVRGQTALIRELFLKSGLLRPLIPSNVAGLWPTLLIRLLSAENRQAKQVSRVLLSEFLAGIERSSKASANDLIIMDVSFWLNQTPIEISLNRGPRAKNDENESKWTLNMHIRLNSDSEVWLKVEHHAATKDLAVTSWVTDEQIFEKAKGSRDEFAAEVSAFGLNLVSFSVVNSARDDIPSAVRDEDQPLDGATTVDQTA